MAEVAQSARSFTVLDYELPALVFMPKKPKMGFVLWLYGSNSNKEKHTAVLAQIAEEVNVPVFCFDYSGHGQAPFVFEKTTPAQHFLEAITVYDELCAEFGCSGGAVIGGSYGGYMLLQLLKYRQIKAGILRAPALLRASSFYTRWEHIQTPSNLHWQDRPDDIKQHPLISRAGENAAPILIIEHEKDEEIPAILPQTLHEALATSDYCLAKGLGHALGVATSAQKQAYHRVMIDWLQKHI